MKDSSGEGTEERSAGREDLLASVMWGRNFFLSNGTSASASALLTFLTSFSRDGFFPTPAHSVSEKEPEPPTHRSKGSKDTVPTASSTSSGSPYSPIKASVICRFSVADQLPVTPEALRVC